MSSSVLEKLVELVSACFSEATSQTLRLSAKASTKIVVEIVIDVSKRIKATEGKAILVGINVTM